ncbi:hypothetical protein KC332_g11067 [Hortaea werneckii]|uniref:Elongin-A n=1 Tax=Hortaea werneckii TaxID=91943 RepID=A0A3M7IRM8_HORWE|nr:hypothetical protein KC358_g8429 [Hortaea werneckii]KAI6829271.1 hypothetical protein KC350_g7881 [Hortaea werneckii]KAI6925862.1 hypothetical protein KC348_g8853 [Hortaea werneckii]KAI6933405.1 hypothetical protein KC341_g8321 [Hortaea werneckii]KAI6968016.1 hypothetical protein KC321_g8692 [Hortaea werneckii]
MPAPTLTSIAQRACVRALPNITDVADIPYELLRPVLKKIINPSHLREIEQNSPQIGDADAELWRAFIARDIPNWQQKIIEPKNPRSWWKVYRKLVREEERAKEEQEAQLAAAMSGIKQEKDANRAQYVQKVIPQGSSRGKAFIDGQPNPALSTGWGGIRVPSLKNAKRGPDALAAIRKQSSQAAKDKGIYKRNDTFNNRMVPNGRTQIRAAPDWMIREKTKPAPGPAAVPMRAEAHWRAGQQGQGVFTGKKEPTARDRALDQAVRSSNAEREARLRALTGAKPGSGGGGAGSPPSATARNVTTATSAPRGASGASGNDLEASAARPSPAVAQNNNKPANPTPATGIVRKRPAAGASPFMPARKVKR